MPTLAARARASKPPLLLYGTAWKEDRTQRLVELAMEQGFRGLDTANQRRHYHEAAVGSAIAALLERGLVARGELFLQTKYTFQRGQDQRLPYDPEASIAVQVEQSFASSLAHLGVERLDSYLLHGPTQRGALVEDDWTAWRAMEAILDRGQVGALGVSNVSHAQLEQLCQQARVQPTFVQNRCYAVHAWDREIRQLCRSREIVYQAFSLLTANQAVLARPELAQIAQRHGKSVAQIVFRFALDLGMLPLTGTTSAGHMRADLDVLQFSLEPSEVASIENLGSH